jgi:hypothetical protein
VGGRGGRCGRERDRRGSEGQEGQEGWEGYKSENLHVGKTHVFCYPQKMPQYSHLVASQLPTSGHQKFACT